MPTSEERRGAVCGRTACTVRCGGGRKPGQSARPRGPGASRRPYRNLAEANVFVLACPSVQLGLPSEYPLLGRVDRHWCGRIHARPPERLLMLRSCCPPSPCGRLSRPRTTTRTPPRPAHFSRHRALPVCHPQSGARRALPTFTMIRLTGSEAGSTPTAHPAGTRSIPPATTPGSNNRAWSEPPSNEAASLLSTTHVR